MPRHDDIGLRCVRAVIEHHEPTMDAGPAPFQLHLCMAGGEQAVATWLTPRSFVRSEFVDIADITLLPCPAGPACQWAAVHVGYAAEASIIDLAPFSLGRHGDIVARWRTVIARIESPPLVALINRVWMRRKVFRDFWKSPASRAHHHAYRGGLAEHSIEVAEAIADTPSLHGTDRDIGIAYALLHDIGKLWSYAGEGTAPFGHERLGLAQLGDALDDLQREWPDGAKAMRALLSGLWKSKGQKPPLAVGKLVQAQDQLSAERDLRPRRGHRYQPWTVRPCSRTEHCPSPRS